MKVALRPSDFVHYIRVSSPICGWFDESWTTSFHEITYMQGHRYRNIEKKFGARVANGIPTRAASALLDRSPFEFLRRTMEQHCLKLVNFLNRQPHRVGGGSMTQLPNAVAATWGSSVIEEVLAFVVTERVTWALTQYQARKTRIGVSQELVPIQFLKTYFRKYWLSDPKDRAALKTKDADRVFGTMDVELVKLMDAVKKHVGP